MPRLLHPHERNLVSTEKEAGGAPTAWAFLKAKVSIVPARI